MKKENEEKKEKDMVKTRGSCDTSETQRLFPSPQNKSKRIDENWLFLAGFSLGALSMALLFYFLGVYI